MRAPSGRPHIRNYVSPDKSLSEEHRRQLEIESAIAPDVIAERGYRTISSRAELLEFKPYQRRAPALYIPMYSPCGRRLPQIKPNTPRKDKDGDAIRYETPGRSEPIIDVHPRNHAALKDTARRLWITEGVKKGDALTTAEEVAISLAGVWMFGTKDGLYPAWDYVALESRDVIFIYDSDIMRKPGVAAALDRGARLLEERGATVSIVYLDDGPNGEKFGVDDYLAREPGGTVAEMVAKAVPYDPTNFEYLRIERNLALKDALAHLWRVHADLPTRTQGENTRRSVMHALTRRAARNGRVVKDGVSVSAPSRSIAIEARLGHKTAARALTALTKAEVLRLERGAAGKKPARYVLLLPDLRVSDTLRGEGAQGRESFSKRQPKHVSPAGGLPLYVSLARAPENPAFCRTCDPCVSLTREGVYPVPELRWSAPSRKPTKKEIHAARTGASEVPLPWGREAIARLGKKRAAIIEHLLQAGGSCEVDDLMARFAGEKTRPRDFVRRQLLPMTDPAIIEIDEGTVTLTKDWEVALEKARELGRETVPTRSRSRR